MTTAAQIAEIHLGPINASRKRAGLPALTLVEAEREFADVNRSPVRTKGVVPSTRSNQAADTMWSGIVQKLNATLPSPAPIGAVRESGDAEGRVRCRRRLVVDRLGAESRSRPRDASAKSCALKRTWARGWPPIAAGREAAMRSDDAARRSGEQVSIGSFQGPARHLIPA